MVSFLVERVCREDSFQPIQLFKEEGRNGDEWDTGGEDSEGRMVKSVVVACVYANDRGMGLEKPMGKVCRRVINEGVGVRLVRR